MRCGQSVRHAIEEVEPEVRPTCRRAIRLVLRSQTVVKNPEGSKCVETQWLCLGPVFDGMKRWWHTLM
jgi:hypothetical protein